MEFGYFQENDEALDEALRHSIEGNPDKSEEILLTLGHRDPRVIFNLGWHEIRHGNLIRGIRGLDAGRWISVFGSKPIGGNILPPHVSISKKRIVLRLEGGYGDQICGVRFVDYLRDRNAEVIIACGPELFPLFRTKALCIHNDYAAALDFDYWVPAMSAPYIFNMEHKDLPNKPYIDLPEPREFNTDKLKVGLRWSGNPKFEHEQYRRFPNELMINLSDNQDCEFYSLQRDDNLVDDLPFTDLRNEMETWKDTAEIIAGLDLLITSDTSVAHLAAAMGKPVWNVIPVLPYYLYAQPGDITPWYPTMELYRQTQFGEWCDVFQRIRTDLDIYVRKLTF